MSKVLQLVYGLGAGGIESFVTALNGCRDVFEEPFDMLSFNPSSNHDFYEETNKKYGSLIFTVGDNCSRNFLIRCFQKRIRTYKFLKKHHYEVVHIHNSSVFCIFEAIAAKKAGVSRVVVHSHNTQLGGIWWKRAIKIAIQKIMIHRWPKYADVYCACSTEAGTWMFGESATKSGKVHVLKNGIIAREYDVNEKIRLTYRRKIDMENCFVVGHVGRFSEQKNHSFLIDIFNTIRQHDATAKLILFGEGELRERIEEKVRNLGIQDSVIFYGLSDAINCWMQAMDVFLLPSLYEGLPVSGIEAQAAGLPVITSDSVSRELRLLDTTEFISLNESVESWAKAVLKYKGRERMSNYSEIVKSGYDIETTARELKKLYES